MTHNEHICAIYCRPEVAGDVISGDNEKIIEGYVVLNFEVASFRSFRDIQKVISGRWRRRRTRRRRRRISTIALSENAWVSRVLVS